MRRRIFLLSLLAVSFAFCEAATVSYIRLVAKIPPGLDYAEAWALLRLPLNGETIVSTMHRWQLLPLEYGREIATLLLLFTAASISEPNRRQRLAAFGFCFTVWDLSYYAWLRLFSGFPRSLFQTDIYFLLPFPTFGPVWFPLALMTAGLLLSARTLARSL